MRNSLSIHKFVLGARYTQQIKTFLPFDRLTSTDTISAQFVIHLDLSGKCLCWAIPHWRAYMAKKLILFQQDETFTGDVKNM